MNLSGFFAVLQVAPSIFQLVDQAVLSVEQSMGGVPGAQKLSAATAKLDGWLKTAGQDVSAIQGASQVVTSLVSTSVAAFNAARVFQKASAAPQQ